MIEVDAFLFIVLIDVDIKADLLPIEWQQKPQTAVMESARDVRYRTLVCSVLLFVCFSVFIHLILI